VSSFLFILRECENIDRETVQFCTLPISSCYLSEELWREINSVVQDNAQEGIVYVGGAFVLDKA
jgi:hypothetical protein